MIINLNEFGGGGGSVSPEEIEEIVNQNHYTKEESDARYEKKEGWWVPETSANTYVALLLTDGSVQVDYFDDGIIPIQKYLNDSTIVSVVIGDGITSIGKQAFYNCSSLPSIEIPNSVTSIGTSAFVGCTSLSSITIPNSVTSIGVGAFSSCSSLTSIVIPNSVTSIGGNAFNKCSSLTSITIPDNVTSIGDNTFSSCSSLTNITIPNSVTEIGGGAFSSCSSLTSIVIPNSVTSIGVAAFSSCSSLTSIVIPNSVTSIGSNAFKNVTTGGTLYCDETWFNNLSSTNKTNLNNVANWTRKPLPKPIEERVDVLEQTKTEKHLLTYDGTSIKDGETIIDYSTLHAMLMDTPDFVVLVYNNRAYHPNVVSDEQIVFISSYVSGGYLTSERLSISDENVIALTSGKAEMEVNKTDSITDENKERTDKYPSLKAVSSYFENRIVILTQAEFEALETKGENTIYLIK